MAEADKETPKSEATSPEPDLIEGEPEEEGEGVVIGISRGVGLAARTMSDGLQSVVDLFRPRREQPVAKPVDKPEELIAALAEMVAAAGDGYPELEDQQDFWELIARLYRVHRRKRVQRQPDEVPRRKLRKKKVKANQDPEQEAEAKESEAKEPEPEPQQAPAKARAKKGATTETASAEKKKKEKAKPKADYEDVLVDDEAEDDTE